MRVYHSQPFLYTVSMSAFLHTLFLVVAVVAAYIWLQIPGLNQYSLQAFVAGIALYVVMKRVKKTELWHIAPTALSLELALITFSFLLLIGFTGATSSVLYPLSYVLLFFVVFSSRLSTALVTVLSIVLFYYLLSSDFSNHSLSLLATLPLLFLFFIFAKAQYQEVTREQAELSKDEFLLSSFSDSHQQLNTFVTSFIQPKLEYILKLLEYPADNKPTLISQIALLQVEIEKMTTRLKLSQLETQITDTKNDQEINRGVRDQTQT